MGDCDCNTTAVTIWATCIATLIGIFQCIMRIRTDRRACRAEELADQERKKKDSALAEALADRATAEAQVAELKAILERRG